MSDQLIIVLAASRQAPWYTQYCDGLSYAAAVSARASLSGVEVMFDLCEDTQPLPLIADIPLFLTSYTLYERLPLSYPNPVIIFENDTLTPFSQFVTEKSDIAIYNHPAVRVITTTTSDMANYIRAHHPVAARKISRLGFPYHNPLLPPHGTVFTPSFQRPKSVVFPQELRGDTVPYMAAALSLRLIKEGWAVEWCLPKPPPFGTYPLDRWVKEGIKISVCDQPALYRRLQQARVAVSTTLNGSMIISLYEAWKLGCIPLAPYGGFASPPFTTPFLHRYPVLDFSEALLRILICESFPNPLISDEWNPVSYLKRLCALVKEL